MKAISRDREEKTTAIQLDHLSIKVLTFLLFLKSYPKSYPFFRIRFAGYGYGYGYTAIPVLE